MAAWQFRCVCCGELRDAPMARPEGSVYLRCVATRQWAWYEPSAFVLAAGRAAALRGGGDSGEASRPPGGRARAAARAGRGGGGRRRVAARPARRAPARKPPGRPRKRK